MASTAFEWKKPPPPGPEIDSPPPWQGIGGLEAGQQIEPYVPQIDIHVKSELKHISVVMRPVIERFIDLLTACKYTPWRSLMVDKLLTANEKQHKRS
jgi:hypothetical protein